VRSFAAATRSMMAAPSAASMIASVTWGRGIRPSLGALPTTLRITCRAERPRSLSREQLVMLWREPVLHRRSVPRRHQRAASSSDTSGGRPCDGRCPGVKPHFGGFPPEERVDPSPRPVWRCWR
jgi:hypothetical protein